MFVTKIIIVSRAIWVIWGVFIGIIIATHSWVWLLAMAVILAHLISAEYGSQKGTIRAIRDHRDMAVKRALANQEKKFRDGEV